MPHSYPDRANGQFPQASWFNGPQKDLKVLTSQVFNVREDTFAGGAKGDGTTDDTAAFQATINAAAAAHGTVFIPPAESGLYYNIASTLTIQPASGSQTWMNIESHAGPNDIRWTGASNASVFIIRGLKYSRITGFKMLLGTQSNVRVFDIVEDATYASCGAMHWTNCFVSLGSGQTNVAWRNGADTQSGDISFHNWTNCLVNSAGDATKGHIAWLNMNPNMLVCQWTNCAWSLVTWGYSGRSILQHVNGAVDATQTTITVNSTIGFAPTGRIKLDTEQIDYTGTTSTTFTGCTRAAGGTAAATHVDNTICYQGIQNPLTLTWAFDRIGGSAHTFTNCGGSFNACEFLAVRGVITVDGGRWEQGARLFQAAHNQSTSVEANFRGVTWGITTALPADGIIVALGAPGVYTFEDCQFYGIDYTAAMFTAGAFDEFAGPLNAFGSLRIQNCTVRAASSPVWTVPATWKLDASGSIRNNTVAQPQAWLVGNGMVSADNADAAKTLIPKVDAELQRWNTALTAARAVTLNTAGATHGDHFRIVREAGATGAFNLNIGTGPLKALTAAGQFADVTFDGTAWRLTGNGSL
jgi:hypothetical protein